MENKGVILGVKIGEVLLHFVAIVFLSFVILTPLCFCVTSFVVFKPRTVNCLLLPPPPPHTHTYKPPPQV